MLISGFTFVRNAVALGYPITESIESILPLVDEFVVNVGKSEDETLDLVRSINSPKIRIIESCWNPNVRTGGYVLAQQTNIALFNCTGDWAIYLQADEAIHEQDLERLHEMMLRYHSDDSVNGLLLRRLSFVGDYKTILNVHPFYRDLACRVVKPHHFVVSRGDAAGFCVHPKYKERGRYIAVVDTGLDFFHYADVRDRQQSHLFRQQKDHLWLSGGPSDCDARRSLPKQFVTRYDGTHPKSMRNRVVQSLNGSADYPWEARTRLTKDERTRWLRTKITRVLGYRVGPGYRTRHVIRSHRGEPGIPTHHPF